MKRIGSIFILLAVTLLCGCKGSEGPTGPAGPALTGTISGVVVLRDLYSVRLTDLGGTNVTIDGTGRSTVTDSLGKWSFGNVTMGTYDITYSKPGFATSKTASYQFIAGGGPGPFLSGTLYQLPDFFPDSLSVDHQDSLYVYLRIVTQQSSVIKNPSIRFFFGLTPATSGAPLTYFTTTGVQYSRYLPGDTVRVLQYYLTNVIPANTAHGTTIYVAAYASVTGSYTDRASGWTIYTGLSQRYSTTSFVVGG